MQREFAERLLQARVQCRITRSLRVEAQSFIQRLLQLLFPHFSERRFDSAAEIQDEFGLLENRLRVLLRPYEADLQHSIAATAEIFMGGLAEIYEVLCLDAEAIFQGDPAAKSVDEVIAAYPGFFAIAVHRVAHDLYRLNVPLLPRIFSEFAHQLTGIDIHPGAEIGRSFCIDHGTGIVIGETTVIRSNVKIYQGVTLGALSVDKGQARKKRHPTIDDDVVIYSNATILGGDTVIGRGSIIGGSVWLTASVPPASKVYHKSEIDLRSGSA